jgi:hypothetical protein
MYTLALLTASSVALTGCTEFPDGPAVSFKSAAKKLAGTWLITEATQGNTDVIGDFAGETLKFEAEGTFERLEKTFVVSVPPFTQSSIIQNTGTGLWQLIEGDTQIDVVYQFRYTDPYNSSVTYVQNQQELWTINRLTEDELWVSSGQLELRLERRP